MSPEPIDLDDLVLGVVGTYQNRADDAGVVLRVDVNRSMDDVILDPVGGPNLAKNLNCLKSRGRLVNIGLLGGRDAQFDMGRLLVKRLRIIGSVLRSRSAAEKETLIASFRERFWDDFYPAGSSDPKFYGFVHDSGSIHHVLDAHETMRANQNIGKLVLEIPHD